MGYGRKLTMLFGKGASTIQYPIERELPIVSEPRSPASAALPATPSQTDHACAGS
jgi:hypothetical protein